MKIDDFGVEKWMNAYETQCQYDLAETSVDCLTAEQVLDLTETKNHALDDLLSLKLTYGDIKGSDKLRNSISMLYSSQTKENVIITHGAIGANALTYETLVEPDDHVIAMVPSYQQHYSIPRSYGANVSMLRLREEHKFLPDLNELRALITPRTKLIALTNPNNPTGALIEKEMLEEIAAIARSVGSYILCDEVYRGIDQQGNGFTESLADLYDKGISTGSMSKAFALAGLRLGWIVAPVDIINDISTHRDYNTISVSMLDDYLATIALENKEAILTRSREISSQNLQTLENWVVKEPKVSFVKPKSGTTALLKIETAMESRDFCVNLLTSKGVLLTPGSVMEMEGYVRIGYVCSYDVLVEGLRKISEFLIEHE